MKNQSGERSPRRRDFLGLTVFATALVGAVVAHAAPAACEAEDDASRASMRRALEYVQPSKTPGKTCAGCMFFTKSELNCGNCQLLSGPVSFDAVCGSWAAKT